MTQRGITDDVPFVHHLIAPEIWTVTVEWTTAKVADITMLESCLHGEETMVLGDRGYRKKNRTIDSFQKEGDLTVLTPTKKSTCGQFRGNRRRSTAFCRRSVLWWNTCSEWSIGNRLYQGSLSGLGEERRGPTCGWHANDCYL